MAILNYSFLCEQAIISREHVPSFISVFSEILVKKIPFTHNQINVVINFHLNDSEKSGVGELKLILKSPSGKVGTPIKSTVKKDVEGNDIGLITKVSQKFDEEGQYEFEIFLDGKEMGKIPLLVKTK
jgi:hypothetical protein